MEYDLPHILAFIVFLLFTIWDMLRSAFNRALGLVSSVRNFFGVGHDYPVGVVSQSLPRNKKKHRAAGRTPGMIERITTLFGLTSIVSLNRRPSLISCLAWVSGTIPNFAATCVNKIKEWNPFHYFALLRQLEAAQREARLLEEGLYRTTVEIKHLKARYKVKEQENLELVRRVAEVEEERAMVIEDLEARLDEKGQILEEEKHALVQEMEILRKEKDVEIELLKAEKEAEIVELKERSRVVEEKNAEKITALKEENEVLREKKIVVEKENKMLREENTKTRKSVEEVQVEVKVAQEKARVTSAQVFGMEIARKEEGKKRMEAESMVVTLREELEIVKQDMEEEKKRREAERVAMALERAACEENTRKSNVEHRQEVSAFVEQLQGAWTRALDLDSQLDVANHHKNVFQAQLKDAQDSLAAMTGEMEIFAMENQKLQEEVARLREEVAQVAKKKEVEEEKQKVESKDVVDFGIDLEKLKKTFEARDWIRRDIPRSHEITVAGECSVMDGEDTMLDITTDRFDTPGLKKRPTFGNKVSAPSHALLVATKENMSIDADTPMVRLPTAGTTRVLPPVQDNAIHTYVPSVETTSMVPLSFDPAPTQVRLPTAPEPPRVKRNYCCSKSFTFRGQYLSHLTSWSTMKSNCACPPPCCGSSCRDSHSHIETVEISTLGERWLMSRG